MDAGVKMAETINADPGLAPARPAKKRSRMTFLRATLLALRPRSKKAPLHLEMAGGGGKKGLFRSLLGAMRPLLLPKLEHRQPPRLPAPVPENPPLKDKEVFLPPPSPCGSDGWFSVDGMSRYASAEDLQALDCELEDEEVAGDGAPNAIDLKAEEFIAMFYAQMKLQRMDSMG